MFKIFDNILDKSEQEYVLNIFLNSNFPYYFSKAEKQYSVTDEFFTKFKDNNTQESKLLVHTFYSDSKIQSDFYHISEFILHKFIERSKINFNTIFRSKLNLQFKDKDYSSKNYMTPHNDLTKKHKVLLYYPNNSDGKTFLFKKENLNNEIIDETEPKQGRYALFDGDILHSGQPPMINGYRLILNYNLL